MARKNEDRFTNLASATVTESAANTFTRSELHTGIGLGQGVGILIDQIDYIFSVSGLEAIVAAGDQLAAGWHASSSITGFDQNDRRQIHQVALSQILVGAVVSQTHIQQPLIYQFFPPMIIAAPRLYLAILGTSLAIAGAVTSRVFFRYIELTDKEYLELAETFILVG